MVARCDGAAGQVAGQPGPRQAGLVTAAVVSFGGADEHGGFVRVAWVTRWHTGQPDLAGEDFAQLAADGRIRLLVSFDGTPPPCP